MKTLHVKVITLLLVSIATTFLLLAGCSPKNSAADNPLTDQEAVAETAMKRILIEHNVKGISDMVLTLSKKSQDSASDGSEMYFRSYDVRLYSAGRIIAGYAALVVNSAKRPGLPIELVGNLFMIGGNKSVVDEELKKFDSDVINMVARDVVEEHLLKTSSQIALQ